MNELIFQNDNIDHKKYILFFLEYLERIIPKNSKDNFYRNVKNLKINLNFDYDFSTFTEDNDENMYLVQGGYNTTTNTLNISPIALNEIRKISLQTDNPQEFYQREVNSIVLHELAHMASSNYNPNTSVSLCGFDKYPSEVETDKNRGITEGMTEVISKAGIPGTIEIGSSYYIEALFINQLIQIVGLEIVLTSYFSNKGTEDIENALNMIIDDKLLSNLLFRRIEDNFQIRELNIKQSILGSIQQTLVTYFENKIYQAKNDNCIIDAEIEQSINIFEQMLVTPEKLKIMQKNPDNYIGLVESIESFNKIKNNTIFCSNVNNSISETTNKIQ